jgi:tetratricopeptide (TPR) repeat protein
MKLFRTAYCHCLLLFLLLAGTATLHAQKKTVTREYYYTASEADSKLTARSIATQQMRAELLREIGEFLSSENILQKKSVMVGDKETISEDFSSKIEAISAGIVEMKTLDERWDGTTYYIKAEMTIDPKDLERRIAEVLNDKHKTEELEEARERILTAEAEIERLKKELEESKDEQQHLALQKKYQQTADVLSAEEYHTKGRNAQENGFNELAIEYYQKATDINPNHAKAYYNMGNAYYELRNYHEAIRYYQKAIINGSNHAKAYYNMGNAYYELRSYHEAIRYYQKAVTIDSNYTAAYNNMGNAYYNLGNKREQIKNYQQAARLGHKNTQKWLRENGYSW